LKAVNIFLSGRVLLCMVILSLYYCVLHMTLHITFFVFILSLLLNSYISSSSELFNFKLVVSTLILDVHTTIIIKFAQFHNVILGGHKMRVFRSATGLVKGGLNRKMA
jgi:hypothetical protein